MLKSICLDAVPHCFNCIVCLYVTFLSPLLPFFFCLEFLWFSSDTLCPHTVCILYILCGFHIFFKRAMNFCLSLSVQGDSWVSTLAFAERSGGGGWACHTQCCQKEQSPRPWGHIQGQWVLRANGIYSIFSAHALDANVLQYNIWPKLW